MPNFSTVKWLDFSGQGQRVYNTKFYILAEIGGFSLGVEPYPRRHQFTGLLIQCGAFQ
jgi:hypothetical protein